MSDREPRRSRSQLGALLLLIACAAAWPAWQAVRGRAVGPEPRAAPGASPRGEAAGPAPRASSEARARGEARRAASGDGAAAADRSLEAAAEGDAHERPAARSLDDASYEEIRARLHAAIERARRDRGLRVDERVLPALLARGDVRIIVGTTRGETRLDARLRGARHEPARYYDHIPFAALQVGPQALLEIVESGDVVDIESDRLHRPSLNNTTFLIGADDAAAAGYDGTGYAVAVLDTGVDLEHPAFAGRILDEACFSNGRYCPNGGKQEFGPGSGAPCTFDTACGHGTGVAGVALGLDTVGERSGVAPDAGLISIQIYSRSGGELAAWTSDIIAALDHVRSLLAFYDVAAVNMSLGGEPFASEKACDDANVGRKAAIDQLRAAGVATVISAGNDGYTDLISEPACISSAVSVGATNDVDEVMPFSNTAHFLDLLAPGRLVLTARQGGTWISVTGTSMSAPHVSGAWASLREAVPDSNVAEVLYALRTTGVPVVDAGRTGLTIPRIDIVAAAELLDEGVDIPESTRDLPSIQPFPQSSDCGLVGLELLLPLLAARRLRERLRRRPARDARSPGSGC